MRYHQSTASRRVVLLLEGMLILVLCMWPLHPALAAPAAQNEARPLLLGEFGSASLAEAESIQYALAAPIDGSYTVVFTGDGDPTDFLLTITGADGSVFYDDSMLGEVVIELAAGDYVFSFAAQTQADLAFLIGIESGAMTVDPDAPGELFNGSVFVTEAVEEALYANVTVAASPYPQQVVVLVQGGEDDIYEVEVTSEEFDYFYTSTDESEFVRFVSSGGTYQLSVAPVDGGASLQVSVFLSGPAPVLAWDVETAGELNDSTDTDIYQIAVDTVGAVVALSAAAEENRELTLGVGFMPEESTWSAYSVSDGPATLEFVAPETGVYYVTVATANELGAAYTIVAEESGRAEMLPVGEPVRGKVASGGITSYLVEVGEPEQFVIVALAGPPAEDLDLRITRYAAGTVAASDSGSSLGSREIVGLFSEEPGAYVVEVDGAWAGASDFSIMASTGALSDLFDAAAIPAPAAPTAGTQAGSQPTTSASGAIEQWAINAEASSQYTEDNWSAQQATGAADTFAAGDEVTAWAAASPDAQVETLTLTYEQAVTPVAIEVHETYNPGAVAKIEVLDLASDEWVIVWEGAADTAGEDIAVFRPELAAMAFVTDQVRLTIDEPLISGWNEIDAVKLIGILGQ